MAIFLAAFAVGTPAVAQNKVCATDMYVGISAKSFAGVKLIKGNVIQYVIRDNGKIVVNRSVKFNGSMVPVQLDRAKVMQGTQTVDFFIGNTPFPASSEQARNFLATWAKIPKCYGSTTANAFALEGLRKGKA